MAVKITKHSKERIVQRDTSVTSFAEAKRAAKTAWKSGQTINDFQKYPKFCDYLRKKKCQSNTCSIRVYRGNIYIWRGQRTLLTAHPIPDRFVKEMEEVC